MVFAYSVKLKYCTNCKIWVHIFVMDIVEVGTNKIKKRTENILLGSKTDQRTLEHAIYFFR